jgi:hypothetical protein
MGGWSGRLTGIDAWFVGAFTSVTGIERRDVERAPVCHFHIVVSVLGRLLRDQKVKLEMTRFLHVTVPSIRYQPCSPSARHICSSHRLRGRPYSNMRVKHTAANSLLSTESGL